jgi:hypothetical protein
VNGTVGAIDYCVVGDSRVTGVVETVLLQKMGAEIKEEKRV